MHRISGARCRAPRKRAFEITSGAKHPVTALQNQRAHGAIVASRHQDSFEVRQHRRTERVARRRIVDRDEKLCTLALELEHSGRGE